jgi:hypothetical protein
MLPQQTHNSLAQASLPSHFYDLDALRESEFTAFAVSPNSDIARFALCELQFDTENALHEKTICAADNLFDCGKSLAETHPALLAKGRLARAVFDILFRNAERPHKLCICPPDQIIFEVPADAPRVLPWLEKCRLRLPRSAVQALCLLLLALAGALTPGDWDDDDDDDEPDRLETANKR